MSQVRCLAVGAEDCAKPATCYEPHTCAIPGARAKPAMCYESRACAIPRARGAPCTTLIPLVNFV